MKVRTETIHIVEYSDFEAFVKKTYGISDFSYCADQGVGHDESTRFTVEAKDLEEDEQEELNAFLADGDYNRITNVLLQDMANSGLIAAGVYLIETN